MIILYTSYYKDKSAVRQAELDHCLEMNKMNSAIDKIVLLCEDELPSHLQDSKIHPLYEGRPTYKRFFELINIYATPNDISIVSNTDIYFDESLREILINGKTCIALSRYDAVTGKLHNCSGSQDTWIFKGKVLPVRHCDFNLGIPGCDNRIAWELQRAGYNMANPASWLKSYHYHPSDLHTYNDENGNQIPHNYIGKPYLFVELT